MMKVSFKKGKTIPRPRGGKGKGIQREGGGEV